MKFEFHFLKLPKTLLLDIQLNLTTKVHSNFIIAEVFYFSYVYSINQLLTTSLRSI